MQGTLRFSRILLLGYLVLLITASLWPTPVDGGGFIWTITSEVLKFCRNIEWLNWLQYNQLEALANVLFYVPLGAFLIVLLPKVKFWYLLAIPGLVSAVMELAQRLALPARYSTLDDVYHNALGGLIGVIISVCIRQLKKWLSSRRSA